MLFRSHKNSGHIGFLFSQTPIKKRIQPFEKDEPKQQQASGDQLKFVCIQVRSGSL